MYIHTYVRTYITKKIARRSEDRSSSASASSLYTQRLPIRSLRCIIYVYFVSSASCIRPRVPSPFARSSFLRQEAFACDLSNVKNGKERRTTVSPTPAIRSKRKSTRIFEERKARSTSSVTKRPSEIFFTKGSLRLSNPFDRISYGFSARKRDGRGRKSRLKP